jgi:peptidoglycan hydrolase-like protein with peptidoglycan-binding domain
MRSKILILSACIAAGGFQVASAQTTDIFLRTLRVGDSGPDVVILQKVLNAKLPVPISRTGPGSPGSETDYFGLKTKAAVIALQEKFGSEALVPAGLRYGTGIVGQLTRGLLNRLWTEMNSTSFATGTSSAGSVHLYSVTPTAGTFGATVTLKGAGFTNNNTIYTGFSRLNAVGSSDGATLSFTIPPSISGISFTKDQVAGADATLPFFVYVRNDNGQSEPLLFTFSPF